MPWSPIPDLARPGRAARLSFAMTLLIAAIETWRGWARLGQTYGDTDDALRLRIVRDLGGGRGWYDSHLPYLQPPWGLDMHWSRLVDGGLLLLDRVFRMGVAPDEAETLMRLVWPLLWVFPLMLGTTLAARRLGGSPAVLAAAVFTACYPILVQFGAGRIDHHNIQIALATLAFAGAINLESKWGAWLAGCATGLMLSVGLEALVFAALCGASIALRFVADAAFAPALRRYAITLALSAATAFMAQTAPALWAQTACDMLAFNLVAALAVLGAGLVAASCFAQSKASRFGALAMAAAAAGSAYLLLDPVCARGPFGHIDPRLGPVWLDHVMEVKSWLSLLREQPSMALALVSPVVIAIPMAACAFRHQAVRRDTAWATALALFVAASLMGLLAVRLLPYSAVFGAVVLGGAFPRVMTRLANSLVGAVVGAMLISPATATALISVVAGQLSQSSDAEGRTPLCSDRSAFGPLAKLSPGLVLADIDLGPHILANTHHPVLAAPYHRMSEGILAAHDLWSAPAAEAVRRLRGRGVSYVILCPAGGHPPIQYPGGSLRRALESGEAPPGLRPPPGAGTLKVWQVD